MDIFHDPQKDHSSQDQQAAADLEKGHAFSQEEIGNDRGEDRFRGHQQVGDRGGNVTQADQVGAESEHGWTRGQKEKNHPGLDWTIAPQDSLNIRGNTGDPPGEDKIDKEQKDSRHPEDIGQGGPGTQTPLRRKTPHQAVNSIEKPGEDSNQYPGQVDIHL